jgi:hypothetical protein
MCSRLRVTLLITERQRKKSIFRESRNNMIHPLTGSTVAASSWFATNTLNEGRYNRRELSHRVFMNYADDFANHSLSGTVGYEELYTRATRYLLPGITSSTMNCAH